MSPIGKVFIVLNLVLSAIFVGAAATLIETGSNYRVEAESLQTQLTDAKNSADKTIGELETEKQNLGSEKDRLASDKAQLQSDKSALEDELKTEREQNADLRERLTSIDGKLGDLGSTNRQQESRIAELNQQATGLRSERDEALDARDSAEQERQDAVRTADAVSRERDELTIALGRSKDLAESKDAKLQEVAKLYKIDLNNLNDQPDLSGRVTTVDNTHGTTVVVVNLGKADGVKPGHTFDVYNGSLYKGKVHVETVNTHQCAATISMAGEGEIAAGDAVVTRL
jgi:multidrug efflux pump subunit AcrA (membrane-fusion protein)